MTTYRTGASLWAVQSWSAYSTGVGPNTAGAAYNGSPVGGSRPVAYPPGVPAPNWIYRQGPLEEAVGAALTAYEEAVVDLGPAIYVPMSESASPLADVSGNAHTTTYASGTVTYDQTGPASPIGGDSVAFTDGSGASFLTDYNPFTNGTTRTYGGWAYWDGAGFKSLIGNATAGNEFSIITESDRDLILYFNFGARATWSVAVPVTAWFHWLLEFNETANTADLWIAEGGATHTHKGQVTGITTAYVGSPGNLVIGNETDSAGATGNWNGRQAHVVVFERALTAGDRAILATGPAITETPTPGGAVAGGTGPVARVPNAVGGAVAAGTGPITRAPISQGGAIAGGVGQLIRVPLGIGGALAGGTGPGESIAGGDLITPGGAIAAGTGPTARAGLSVGGALAAGMSQNAVIAFVIGPGGAVAGGTGPDDGSPPAAPTGGGKMRVLVSVDEMPVVSDQQLITTLR